MRAPEASPAGAVRERETRCPTCGRKNWNHSARCWLCIDLDSAELHDGDDAA